jgi:hypothetical protein
MTDVIVDALLGQPRPKRQGGGCGAGREFGISRRCSARSRRPAALRRTRAQIVHLCSSSGAGELEPLDAVRGQVMVGPDPGDGHAADLQVVGRVRVDQGVRPLFEGGPASVTATISARRACRSCGAGRNGPGHRAYRFLAASRPRQRTTAWREQRTRAAISVLGWPSAASSTIRGHITDASPALRLNATSAEASRGPQQYRSGDGGGGMRESSYPFNVAELQRRNTSIRLASPHRRPYVPDGRQYRALPSIGNRLRSALRRRCLSC